MQHRAAALLPSLYKRWWMCCDNRQRRSACASSPNSSWQQPWSSCRIDRDSRRHTDLFNVVSLNTLSCATHNADTDRKSLSVCLKSEGAENVLGSVAENAGVHLHTSLANASECGISSECEVCLQWARGKCCHPIGCHGFLTVYKILRHLHTLNMSEQLDKYLTNMQMLHAQINTLTTKHNHTERALLHL